MKYIRSFYSGWKLVSDEKAEQYINMLYERSQSGCTKEEIKKRHLKEIEEVKEHDGYKENQ